LNFKSIKNKKNLTTVLNRFLDYLNKRIRKVLGGYLFPVLFLRHYGKKKIKKDNCSHIKGFHKIVV